MGPRVERMYGARHETNSLLPGNVRGDETMKHVEVGFWPGAARCAPTYFAVSNADPTNPAPLPLAAPASSLTHPAALDMVVGGGAHAEYAQPHQQRQHQQRQYQH